MHKIIKFIIILVLLFFVGYYFYSNPLWRLNNSSKFSLTSITSVLDTKIDLNKNLIYSSTFQIAWNESYKLLKETIEIENAPEYVSQLNNLIDQPIILNQKAYIAMAGTKKENIIENINQNLKKDFYNTKFIKNLLFNDFELLIYSYLEKNVMFEYNFENIDDEALTFKFGTTETKVLSFGIKNYRFHEDFLKHELLSKQVEILYWCNNNFFLNGCIVKLKSSLNDDVIISTLPVEDTLKKTFVKIQKFIDYQFDDYAYLHQVKNLAELLKSYDIIDVNFKECNSLMIPKINFMIFHSYDELSNKKLLNLDLTHNNYYISNAIHDINFTINKFGSKSESSPNRSTLFGSQYTPRPLHINGPFVIFIRKKSSILPYFMAYIANDELLEKYQ